MNINRRKFLKITGVATAALAIKSASDLLNDSDFIGALHAEEAEGIKEGVKWGMLIDLRKCDECKKCVEACRSAHNIPEFNNLKDQVDWIWLIDFEKAFPEQFHKFMREDLENKKVPILCNHCDDAPCVKVCPTKATWKREDGIVMMDYHRCIGCRYCMAACPYGSRSFNWRNPRPYIREINEDFPTRMKGVVEKCNFCAERLREGKQPACVEACDRGAMIFGDLNDENSEIRKKLKEEYAIVRKPAMGTHPNIYYII
ncbi:MAG: 4Fe-4S ferredoxin [Thermoplasmata archaeon]|nr:MAG: 4Fe-4S ferredoxin [Thermoplasmata archaeon]